MLDVSATVTPRRRRIKTDTVKLIGILSLWAEHIQSVSEDIAIVALAHQDRQIEKNPRLCQFRVRFSRNTVRPKIGYRTICRVLKPVWELEIRHLRCVIVVQISILQAENERNE